MKISEMSTAKAADVLVKIVEPVTKILMDQEAVSMLQVVVDTAKDTGAEGIIGAFIKIVPYLLEKHRNDTFTIIGALNGKSVEKVAKQNILQTIADVRESIDKDLIDFFKSSAGLKTPGGEE